MFIEAPQIGRPGPRLALPEVTLALALVALSIACPASPPPHPTPPKPASADAGAPAAADAGGSPASVADAAPSPAANTPPGSPLPLAEIRALLRAGQRAEAISALKATHPTLAPGLDRDAALYLLGRLLTEEGDPAALAALERLPVPFEDNEELRLLWLSRAQVLAGQDARVLETTEALFKLNPSVEGGPRLRLDRARALHKLGRPAEAIAELGLVRGERRLEAEALRLEADWARAADPDRALALDKRLLTTYPDEPAALKGLPLKIEALSWPERYRRAKTLMARWQYDEARDEFRAMIAARQYVYDARWSVAVISLRKIRDEPTEARDNLHLIIKWGGPHKEEAHLLLMRSYMREEKYDEAIKVAEAYNKAYPEGEHIETLSYYSAWLPYDHNNCKAAMPRLKEHAKKYSERRSLVLGFYAWCAVRMEAWQQAYWAMGALIPLGNTVVRGKAHYWRAVALDKLGKRPEALKELDALHKVYPLTWYDILGQQLRASWEGRDPRASLLPWPEGGGRAHLDRPQGEEMWDVPTARGAVAERFGQVRRLVELGEIDRAREAYASARAGVEAAVPAARRHDFIRFMGHQVEDYRRGWELTANDRLSTLEGLPDARDPRWLLAYPRAYEPMVERLSREFDLPSAFIYGIMRQESRYNPEAISHTDAVGALQMIPQTARLVAADMGVVYDPETFPRPEVSFRYSLFYLRKLARTFKNQLVLVAAGYNGGPEPVARWMKESPGVELARLIEEFAYNESRIYCRKVAEHTLLYLYLYEPDPAVRGRWLDALFPTEVNFDVPEDVGY